MLKVNENWKWNKKLKNGILQWFWKHWLWTWSLLEVRHFLQKGQSQAFLKDEKRTCSSVDRIQHPASTGYIVQSRIKSVIYSENWEEVQIGSCLICFLISMFASYKGDFFAKHIHKDRMFLMEEEVAKKCALGKWQNRLNFINSNKTTSVAMPKHLKRY